jgi:hypothetical protein
MEKRETGEVEKIGEAEVKEGYFGVGSGVAGVVCLYTIVIVGLVYPAY